MVPNQDTGGDTDLTRTSGTKNYQCVDEIGSHNGDTDYVYAATTESYIKDIYGYSSSGVSGNVLRLSIYFVAKYVPLDSAPTPLNPLPMGRVVMKDGSIYNRGPDIKLTNTYQEYSTTWWYHPATGDPWKSGDLNSLKAGIELQSVSANGHTYQARCTQMWIVIEYGTSLYDSPGTLTSVNLLSLVDNDTIDSFDYIAPAIPNFPIDPPTPAIVTNLEVQFSQNGTTDWYNSSGTPGGWDTMSEGTHNIDLSGLGWSGDFYYRVLFTSNGYSTPVLDYVAVNYSLYVVTGYALSGTIDSQVFDTSIPGATWDLLAWDETLPAGTNITFEVRAWEDGDPTPSWTSIVGDTPITSGLPSGQYKQWRATLTTDDPNETPILHEVRVWYDP